MKIPTPITAAAFQLLSPYVPDLTPETFMERITESQSNNGRDTASRLLTVAETSSRLRITRQTLHRMTKAGDISTVRIGSRVFVHVDTIEAIEAGGIQGKGKVQA